MLFGGLGSCCSAHAANFLYREQRVATCYWTSATDFLQHREERPHARLPSCCMFKSCLPRGCWPPQPLSVTNESSSNVTQPDLRCTTQNLTAFIKLCIFLFSDSADVLSVPSLQNGKILDFLKSSIQQRNH